VPTTLGRYLKFYRNSLEIGDSGWDPDFPASAELSERMYKSATGNDVDGSIWVDPYLISQLLTLTGPVDVKGYGSFDSGNFFGKLNHVVNVENGPGNGLDAIVPISQAVLERVLTLPPSQSLKMLTVLRDSAASRHVMVRFHDPELASLAAAARYDGALLPVRDGDDYLFVADGNVGGNKADYYIKKSMEVRAELTTDGLSRHQASLLYDYPPPVDADDRALNPGTGAYRDYVRFYLPQTAGVQTIRMAVDGKPAPIAVDSITIEHGHKVIGVFITAPRGHQLRLELFYLVPLPAVDRYHVTLQKQAGIPVRPTQVLISRPGGRASRSVPLDRDAELTFTW